MIKQFLFRLVKWIIRRYFNNGLNAIMANDDSSKVIAWKWIFYDEKYEQTR